MSSTEKQVRVFISRTFRDMQAVLGHLDAVSLLDTFERRREGWDLR